MGNQLLGSGVGVGLGLGQGLEDNKGTCQKSMQQYFNVVNWTFGVISGIINIHVYHKNSPINHQYIWSLPTAYPALPLWNCAIAHCEMLPMSRQGYDVVVVAVLFFFFYFEFLFYYTA